MGAHNESQKKDVCPYLEEVKLRSLHEIATY